MAPVVPPIQRKPARPSRTRTFVCALALTAALLLAGWFAPSAEAAPVNDNFADAITLVGDDPFAVALMDGSTVEANELYGSSTANTVWYTWTPTTTHLVALGAVSDRQPRTASQNVSLYTGSTLSTLVRVPTLQTTQYQDRQQLAGATVSLARVIAGQQYKVQVLGSGFNGVPYAPFQAVAIPPITMLSDTFAAAPIAQVGSGWSTGGLAANAYGWIDGATREAGEPVHAGAAGGARTIWRRMTVAQDTALRIDTVGSEFDTALGIYTGSAVGGLVEIASNDNASGSVTTSSIDITLQAHVVYRIAISDTGSGSGMAVLRVNSQPSANPGNDLFVNRNVYTLASAWWDFGWDTAYHPVSTPLEPGEPATIGGATDTYWMGVQAPRSGTLPVVFYTSNPVGNCDGTDFNVEAFTGSALGSLTLIKTRLIGSNLAWDVPVTAGVPVSFRISGVVAPPTCQSTRIRMVYGMDVSVPDAFADAIDISSEATSDSFNEYISPGEGTLEPGEPTYADGTDRTLWYKITPSVSRQLSLTVAGYGQSSLHVFSGTTLGSLVPVTNSTSVPYVGTNWPPATVSFPATAGTTYYLAAGGVGSVAYSNLKSVVTAPPNDAFAARIVVGPGPVSTAGTALAATREVGEPTHTTSTTPTRSAWYSWTATETRRTRIDMTGTTFTSSLGVYTGTDVGALSLVGRDDGTGAGTNRVVFDAVAGTTYHVAVSASQFILNFDMSDANDKFFAATSIAGANGRTTGTTYGASRQPGEPAHAGNSIGNSVWYAWTAPATGAASFDTSGSDMDTVIGIYTGSSVEDLVGVAANDDAVAGGTHSRVSFAAVAGQQYRIAIEGKSGLRGAVVLRWRAPELHDMQAAPIVIPAAGGASASNLQGAGTQQGEPNPCPVSCDSTVWYDWTPSFSGMAGIRTSAASFDTVLAAYTGVPGSLSLVASNDNFGGATTSRLRFAVTSGTTYRIQVASKVAAGSGTFRLDANVAPANNDFAAATALTGASAVWTGHNFGATSEAGEPDHAGIAGGRSVWLRWVATSTGSMSVDTIGSEIDTLLGVYTGAAVGSLTPVASDDDAVAPASRVTFAATSGVTYYIAIDGKAGDVGDLLVHLNVPSNDMVASPTAMVDSGFTPIAGSTIAATRELGEPDFDTVAGDNSVWFQWTITTEASRVLRTSDTNVRLEVFSSPAFATLRPVDRMSMHGWNSGIYRGRLQVGTYWVRASSAGHNFTLTSPPSPANDDIASAQVIVGTGPWAGDDTNAAGEALEYDLGYRVPAGWSAPSTWFAWTAPSTAVTSFGIDGSHSLSIWRDEADRANMLRVDVSGSSDKIRTFSAQAGVTYLIRTGATTAAPFTLSLNPAPANDAFASAVVLGDPIANRASRDSSGGSCESGEPNHAGVTCAASMWYQWTPSTSGTARITTVGSRVSTTVAMYTGATLGTLVQVGASAGPHPGYAKGAQFDVAVTATTTYYIAISARSAERGETHVQAAMVVPGDDVAAPIDIVGDSGSVSGTTVGATVERESIDDMTGGSYSGARPDPPQLATVWVRWVSSYTGVARLQSSIGFGGQVDVLSGSSGDPAFTWIDSTDPGPGSIPAASSPLLVPVNAGETYWFRVGDRCCFGSYWGTWTVNVNQTPNDAFISASTFGGTASRVIEHIASGSTEAGEPNHGGAGDPRTFWWNWTAPANATVSFTTARSDLDTALGVYTGAAVGSLALVAQDDNSISDDARVQFAAVAGTTYRIAVGVSGSAIGLVSLRRDAPVNDEADTATLISGSNVAMTSSIANAAFDMTERTRTSMSVPDSIWSTRYVPTGVVWYRWVAPASAPVVVTRGSSMDRLFAFSGVSPATMTRTAAIGSATSGGRQLRFDAVAGTTYHLAVGQVDSTYQGTYSTSTLPNGIDAGEGEASFSLVQRPPNDDFANSTVVAGWSATETVNTSVATREVGEPDHSDQGGRSVWYSWTAPTTGDASISTVGSDFDTLIGVYTGATLGTITSVTTRDDYPISTRATVTFNAVAGTTYRIAIDGYRGASGTAVVGVNVRPPNDDFANAYPVSGDVARTSGYSINSTVEGGETDHAAAGTDSSVWWTWTPTTSHAATIDTYGSDFDTVLGVYTGAAVGSLVEVASNDDTAGTQSRVTFAAVAGTTYRIAVAGAGDVGNVRIRMNPRLPLVPDLISPIAGATSASRIGPFRARAHHEDVAVLVGIQVEVCDDAVAPADPWSVNCVAGYQVATGPTLVGDGGTQDVSMGVRMPAHAAYHWRARTIDDAGGASAWSAPETMVVGTTQSIAVSTLGYSDTARNASGVSFGTMLPTEPHAIGPANSGQAITGAAVEVMTDSDHGTRVMMRAADFSDGGGNTIPATALAWKDHTGVGETMQQLTWIPFTMVDSLVEDRIADGPTTYRYDMQLTVPAATPPGTYVGSTSITVVPQP